VRLEVTKDKPLKEYYGMVITLRPVVLTC